MAFNFKKFFQNIFGGHSAPTPTPVPTPAPVNPLRPVGIVVALDRKPIDGVSVTLDGGATGVTDANGYVCLNVPSSLSDTQLTLTKPTYKPYSQHVTLPSGGGVDLCVVQADAVIRPDQLRMPPMELLVVARRGIVRAEGRDIKDDDGFFYPLGATLFWALRGWKFDRDRLKLNVQWLKLHKIDYVRILCEVGWAGNDINPAWDDYDTVFTEFLDYCYDVCGMRAELTVVGGGTSTDYVKLAGRIATLIKGREHKVLSIEAANESFKNLPDTNILKQMCRILRDNTPCLVAASSEGNWNPDGREAVKESMNWGCTLGTTHMDRGTGDDGWRFCRQPWDWHSMPIPIAHNEPIGPRSSVAESTDALQLAMLRTTGILCGVPIFVIHNAAGVAGQVDPQHNRPANLWEVPGIDAIMQAIRNVDAFLPAQVSSGTYFNNHWGNHPCQADSIWPDTSHGVNRQYLVTHDGGFFSVLNGITGDVTVHPVSVSKLSLFDPVTGQTTVMAVTPGQPCTIAPASRDAAGHGAFIMKGE